MKRFNPKCLTGEEDFAVNNRNQLMPCCLVDNKLLETQELRDLFEVSNIEEHDSIEDILKKKEWTDFFNMLVEAERTQRPPIPRACRASCYKMDVIRKQNWQEIG